MGVSRGIVRKGGAKTGCATDMSRLVPCAGGHCWSRVDFCLGWSPCVANPAANAALVSLHFGAPPSSSLLCHVEF